MKIYDRLDLFVVGDRLHRKRAVEKSAELRLEEKQQLLKTHEYKTELKHEVRNYKISVEPGPNAPLLKRLITNPQNLELGYFSRKPTNREKLADRPKPKSSTIIYELLRENKSVHKIRPMSFHIRPEPIIRPPVDAWLIGEDND